MSFGFGFGFTKITAAIRAAFSPSSLFATNEPGVWYDPSDLSTLFQDAAGTTPVTAVEQPVGRILDKSGNGFHATQSTSTTSRPVLSARVNLLTKTEQFDDAAWTKVRSNITQNAAVAPDGTFTADKWIEDTTTANNHLIYGTLAAFTAGVSYTLSLYAKAAERSFIQLTTGLAVGGETRWANFNLSNGTIGSFGADATPSITAVGNGWFHCQIVFTSSTTAIENLTAALVTSATAERLEAYTGDGTSGIYIWGASLVPANQSSLPYQRVNTATDYDADPAKFPAYLRFDGADDWLVTPTITPGTDKAQVFAGARRLANGAQTVMELSANYANNNGTVGVFADGTITGATTMPNYAFELRGTTVAGKHAVGYGSPVTSVLAFSADLAETTSTSEMSLRVNGLVPGVQQSSTANAGTGNFLAYPLYIGRRGGTTLPFNGHIYSLIVRFGANLPAATIENTEKYINTKTRAY